MNPCFECHSSKWGRRLWRRLPNTQNENLVKSRIFRWQTRYQPALRLIYPLFCSYLFLLSLIVFRFNYLRAVVHLIRPAASKSARTYITLAFDLGNFDDDEDDEKQFQVNSPSKPIWMVEGSSNDDDNVAASTLLGGFGNSSSSTTAHPSRDVILLQRKCLAGWRRPYIVACLSVGWSAAAAIIFVPPICADAIDVDFMVDYCIKYFID